MTSALERVHVGSLLTRETAPSAWILDPIDGSNPDPTYFRVHVHMTCFTDKRYEDREYLYTRTRARQRQPGDV